MITEDKIYETIGRAGFTALVGAFYRRVKSDDLLGPMYPPDDFEAAEQRLADFLIQRFGGPGTYSQQRGHPRLRMRHAPFPIDVNARNRWVSLMDQALGEAEKDASIPAEVSAILRKYFSDTATFMMNR
jgi:hemoglobin